MTPETLIMIATLSTGAVEWQPMPAHLCAAVVETLERGEPVKAERHDGEVIEFTSAYCIADSLAARLELTPPHLIGVCSTDEAI